MQPVREQVRMRLSVAVQLVDARTGAVLTSGVEFSFPPGQPRWIPRLTPDGYHVFVGMPPGAHPVRITARAHQPLDTSFSVPDRPDASNAVLVLPMQPEAPLAFR